MRRLGFVFAWATLACAAIPDFYRHVDRLFWVVDDIDRTSAGWSELGVASTDRPMAAKGRVTFRGAKQAIQFRCATARFADIRVDFVQPQSGVDAFSDFRKRHGPGILAIVHRAPGPAELEAEIARMKSAGVGVLQAGELGGDRYVLFDTEAEGKYVLGLVAAARPETVAAPARKISQYAFVARDLKRISGYWEKLGFPAMSFTHPPLWDLKYHDQPGRFDALLGWQRHGAVIYEWIQPLQGPTVYNDQMAAHGEGVHHLALDVANIDAESAKWTRKGYAFVQGGAWGERGKPGYGRFAYQNTQTLGGADVELLWNYRTGK